MVFDPEWVQASGVKVEHDWSDVVYTVVVEGRVPGEVGWILPPFPRGKPAFNSQRECLTVEPEEFCSGSNVGSGIEKEETRDRKKI